MTERNQINFGGRMSQTDNTLDKKTRELLRKHFGKAPNKIVEDFKSLIADREKKMLEFVIGEAAKLNDIYGNDPRNNYGYHETQVRDAAQWLQRKISQRAKEWRGK